MILDFSEGGADQEYSADVVIIGAGAVGLTCALSLQKSGKTVLILEAGGEVLEAKSQQFLRDAVSSGLEFEGLNAGRFSGLGGTTTAWGGQLVTMDSVVFEKRPWISDVGWPIDRSELDQFYVKTAKLLGAKDPLVPDNSIWEKLESTAPNLGDDVEVFFSQWLKQPNLGALFYPILNSDPRISVLTHARAVKFDTGGSGRIQNVLFQSPDKRRGIVRADFVVLAAGTIETSRLLLCPLADGGEAEWSENAWLGRCFIDHVEAYAGKVVPIDLQRFHDYFDNALIGGIKYVPRFKIAREAQRQHKLVGCGAHFIFNSLIQEHLSTFKTFIKTLMSGRWPRKMDIASIHFFQLTKIMLPLIVRYLRTNRILSVADGGIQLRLSSEQIPIAESRISLGKKLDPLGLPVVDLCWKIDGREVRSMAFLAKKVRDGLSHAKLANVEINEMLIQESSKFLEGTDDAFHQMGGVRLGVDKTKGVVDVNCKVYGAENLFAAGACTFPTSGFENPTFTAMAMGVRLGEHLATK